MKIEHTEVFGFTPAIRGMRNPLDSWDKSDSGYFMGLEGKNANREYFVLGDEDMKLSQKLTKTGSEHCKHLRMIGVWVDLTLPRFIWSEFDTYHFNTKNSCSTMHTIHRRRLTQDDFEYPIPNTTLGRLNFMIQDRLDGLSNPTEFIRMIKNELPDGYLQKRTVFTTYAELYNMLNQREYHRLEQWNPNICNWIVSLPYLPELTGYEIKQN